MHGSLSFDDYGVEYDEYGNLANLHPPPSHQTPPLNVQDFGQFFDFIAASEPVDQKKHDTGTLPAAAPPTQQSVVPSHDAAALQLDHLITTPQKASNSPKNNVTSTSAMMPISTPLTQKTTTMQSTNLDAGPGATATQERIEDAKEVCKMPPIAPTTQKAPQPQPVLRKVQKQIGIDGKHLSFTCSKCFSKRAVMNGQNDGQHCTRCFNKAVNVQHTSLAQKGPQHQLQVSSTPNQATLHLTTPSGANQQQRAQQNQLSHANQPILPIMMGQAGRITLHHADADAARQYIAQPPAAHRIQIKRPIDDYGDVKNELYMPLCTQLLDAVRQPFAPASATWDEGVKQYYEETSRDMYEQVRHKLQTDEQIRMAHAYAMIAVSDAASIHEFGIPKIAMLAFPPDTTLTCRARVQRMIDIVKAKACAKKDVVLGKTRDLVWNPSKYSAGKEQNMMLNSKRRGDLKFAAEEKNKRTMQGCVQTAHEETASMEGTNATSDFDETDIQLPADFGATGFQLPADYELPADFEADLTDSQMSTGPNGGSANSQMPKLFGDDFGNFQIPMFLGDGFANSHMPTALAGDTAIAHDPPNDSNFQASMNVNGKRARTQYDNQRNSSGEANHQQKRARLGDVVMQGTTSTQKTDEGFREKFEQAEATNPGLFSANEDTRSGSAYKVEVIGGSSVSQKFTNGEAWSDTAGQTDSTYTGPQDAAVDHILPQTTGQGCNK